jgi:hypothetical protein
MAGQAAHERLETIHPAVRLRVSAIVLVERDEGHRRLAPDIHTVEEDVGKICPNE